MFAAALPENAHSHMTARASHCCAIGSYRLQEMPPLSLSPWRSRMDPSSMLCWTAAWPSTQSIPSSSTVCVIASASLVPRTIGETPTSRPMGCVPIGICFAVCKLLIRASSSCVGGRGLPKSSSRKGCGSAIACTVNSGGIIPRCSGSATILLPVGFSIFGQWRPAKAMHLRKTSVAQLLKRNRIRRIDAETVLRALREPAINVADGVAEAATIHIGSLITRLRVVGRQLHDAVRKLDELCACLDEPSPTAAEHGGSGRHDVKILKSMPGIGKIILAILLAEASGPLSRRDYQALRTLSGVAPVTKQSGKSRMVVRRYAAHVRLRDAVYHWARVAIQHDPRSHSRYVALRQRGHSHGRAIRGVADRLALACTLLQR